MEGHERSETRQGPGTAGILPVRVQGLQISLYEELDFLQDFFKQSKNTALSLGSQTMQSADSGGDDEKDPQYLLINCDAVWVKRAQISVRSDWMEDVTPQKIERM